MAKRIIVIGSGAAGMTAASQAREHRADSEITVFTEEEQVSYSPCAIPFVIEGRIKDFDSIVMHTPQFYQDKRNIKVQVRTKVSAVDMEKRTIMTAGGVSHPYDALIIATGGTVFVPPIEGTKLKGVHSVHTISDGRAIQAALKGAESVVVAGAGVIGLEMAVALKRAGKSVTVVEMFPQVVPRILDADMAALVQRHCESLGIGFVMSTPMGAIKGSEGVEAVVAGGQEIKCQMVIMATGVRANLELPNLMGLEIGPLGAARVGPTLQPYRKGRLVKEVFLAGDVIQCESAVAPGPTMSQLGSSAVRQGRVAGINAAGGYATYAGVASAWVSCLGDLQVAGTGLSKGLADYYGMKVMEGKAEGSTRARYYPGGKPLVVKVLAERETRRLVGAQIVAGEEATGRINWLTAAILKGVTLDEFVADFENAYCPPTSMVKDVVNSAVEDLQRKLVGTS
jgi:NADH oxidase (H2O2-forming)